MAVGGEREGQFADADDGGEVVGRAVRGAQGQGQGHEVAGGHFAARHGVGGEGDDRQRVVGDPQPGREREGQQPAPVSASARGPARQQKEVGGQEGGGDDVGVGVNGVLPDVSGQAEGQRGEDGGDRGHVKRLSVSYTHLDVYKRQSPDRDGRRRALRAYG